MDMIRRVDKLQDDWVTPPEVWENITDFLPVGKTDVVVWEPFYNDDSTSANTLRKLGCQVIYGNIDFFQHALGTCIITNPPFSCKEKVFERLKQLDLPFILTIPVHSLCTRFIKNTFKNKLQLIIPDTRLHFQKLDNETGELVTVKRTPFDCIYVCYKMNLPRDVIWLD